jgi:hypothetical protein
VTFKDKAKEPIVLFRYVDFHMLQDNPDTDTEKGSRNR